MASPILDGQQILSLALKTSFGVALRVAGLGRFGVRGLGHFCLQRFEACELRGIGIGARSAVWLRSFRVKVVGARASGLGFKEFLAH